VVVIGGGSAGLSAALMLGRARRRVMVVDAGMPRNRFAAHMHGGLGLDGMPPLDLLATGRREVGSYGGEFFTVPRLVPLDEPLRQLGAERTEYPWGSFATTDPSGQTSVTGVWAAGNVVNAMANVPVAAGAGALAAGAINHALVLDEVREALAACAQAGGTR